MKIQKIKALYEELCQHKYICMFGARPFISLNFYNEHDTTAQVCLGSDADYIEIDEAIKDLEYFISVLKKIEKGIK